MIPRIRVELLIPTHYNPDDKGFRKSIEPEKHRHLKNQIIKKFDAISIHPLTIQGVWVKPGTKKRYFDQCYKYEVCIDEKENLEGELEKWKEDLKELFKQFEIFMVYYQLNQI